jgi:hypothetical protein
VRFGCLRWDEGVDMLVVILGAMLDLSYTSNQDDYACTVIHQTLDDG